MKKLRFSILFALVSALALSVGTAGCKREKKTTTTVVVKKKGSRMVVASRRGKVYHRRSSPDARKIKRKNRIAYPSRGAAEAAGRRPHRCIR